MSRGVSPRLRTFAALLAFGTIVLSSAVASAQQPEAQWAFAPIGPFADERVVTAMRLQMDADSAASVSGVSLDYYGGGELAGTEDPVALLAAAGFLTANGSAPGIVIERPCRVWAASPGLEGSALALGEELAEVWAAYGIDFAACTLSPDPLMSDIFVFPAGAPPTAIEEIATQGAGSFIGFSPDAPGTAGPGTAGPGETPPVETPATGGVVVDPIPADGGTGAEEAPDDSVAIVVGSLLLVAVLAIGRGLTAYRPV